MTCIYACLFIYLFIYLSIYLFIYLSIYLQVNAYLQQRLGFNNTARLQGGIVSYARELQRINTGDVVDDIGGGGGGYDDSGDDGNTRSGDRLDQQNDSVELEIVEPHRVVGSDASIYPRIDKDSSSSSSSSSYSKNVGVINDTGDNTGYDSRSIERSKSVVTGPPSPIPPHHHHHRSMFRGVNYVFDERIGSRVTEDVLRRCEQCDGVSDNYNNCLNYDCNVSYTELSRAE
jgi:hypothetical protein